MDTSASAIVSLMQTETQHAATIATMKAQQDMQVAAIKMAVNEARAATPGEGIGANVDRHA